MQFKVGDYRDGDRKSNIRMLTGTIKADWIQLPVERYLAALPTLRDGVIAGVFRNKGAAPWGITRAEKLQLSVFLPNDLSLDDWYAGAYALPTVWPDVSPPEEEVWCPEHVGRPWPAMATPEEPARDQRAWLVFAGWARRAAFYKQVESAWWWHERGTAYWWRPCGVAALVYYAEPALAFTPTCSTLGVSGRTRDFPWYVYPSPGGRTNNFPSIYPHSGGCIYEGTKEEEAGWRQCPDWVATMLRVLIYGTSIGGMMLRQGLTSFGHLVLWPIYLKRVALFCLPTSHWKLEWLDSSPSGTYRRFACGPQQIGTYYSYFYCYCLEDGYDALLVFGGLQGIEP